VAKISYREAVGLAIAQEMERDPTVILIGEDVAAAGGVFKATTGLRDRFGAERVRDTPISEQAIVGAVMGAAMTGLRPIGEVMYADFLAVCWDQVANQVGKARYMSGGQFRLPLVLRAAGGGGLGFGAQHSQSPENWAMAVPGLKVVCPSTPADVVGLLAAAVRDEDPVVFFEHKALYAQTGELPEGEHVEELGVAKVRREGSDVTVVSISAMVHRSLEAAARLAEEGVSVEVVDLRCLVPLDVSGLAASVRKTGKVCIVEENPRLCGWGAEIASIIAEELFYDLDGPVVRVTCPHVPVPAARSLEAAAIPTAERIAEVVMKMGVT
jgi:pyruvate/2-oxoglutarate/acetoin dehydrogenase E1 component